MRRSAPTYRRTEPTGEISGLVDNLNGTDILIATR